MGSGPGSQQSVSGPVYVSSLTSTGFSPVGGAVGSCNQYPSITDVGGTPYVACIDSANDTVDVYQFNGSAWVQVGPAISGAAFGATLGGIADVGGEPYVAFAQPNGGGTAASVVVDGFSPGSGGHWSQVGASLIGQSGDYAMSPTLLADGSTPIVAWTEDHTVSGGGSQTLVYADQLQGGAWSGLNSGNELNLSATDNAQLGGLTTIGTTPYLAFDDFNDQGMADGYAFALSGSSFAQAGGAIVANTMGTLPQTALGSYNGAPLAIVNAELPTGDEQLQAEQYAAGAWGQLGSALGVPPLPGPNGDPYAQRAVTVDAQTGTPYVAFMEQEDGTQFTQAPENLFVEDYTTNGTNPNTPPPANSAPPTVTITTTPGAIIAAAASLDLVGAPTLVRHGRAILLHSGFRATCPSATGKPACRGSITLNLPKLRSRAGAVTKALQIKLQLRVASGRTQAVIARLSAASAKQLRRRAVGHRVDGTVKVALTGPNAKTVSLSQSLDTRVS